MHRMMEQRTFLVCQLQRRAGLHGQPQWLLMKSRKPQHKYSLFIDKRNHTTPARILVCFSFSPLSSALIRPSHSITECNYFKCNCSIRQCLLSTEHLGDFCGDWLASCSLRLKQEGYYHFIRGCFLVPLGKWQLNVEVMEHFQVSVCLTKEEDLIE